MKIEICFKDHAFTPITMECHHYEHSINHRMFLIYPINDSQLGAMIPDNAVNYIRTIFDKEETE